MEPESKAELEVNLALIGECPGQPSLTDIRNYANEQLREAFVRFVQILTGATGQDEAVLTSARRFHALVDGLALHLLHADPTDTEWALDLVREEIVRISSRTGPTPPPLGP